VRIGGGPVIAPTPPPDIDLDAWRASLDAIESWSPARLAVTHFGAHEDVAAQLAALREHLDEVERWAAQGDSETFVAQMRARVAGEAAYAHALPPEQSYHGLARYLSKRAAA
jgi:glyoxylase-like metal-dependent hydrolase (beta-lactamase superfamily II)